LLFNYGLEYTIRKVQAKKDSWKLNGTHQLLVYADDIGWKHTGNKEKNLMFMDLCIII
jgi:hypothetical protein